MPAVPVPVVQPAEQKAAAAVPEDAEYTAFDFSIGGNSYGLVYGHFGDDWFQVENPEDLIVALPEVKDRQAFRPLFEGRIPGERKIPELGVIRVDVVRFIVELEIAEAQTRTIRVRQTERPEATETNLSVRNSLFATSSTDTESVAGLSKNISINHDTIFSKGRKSLRFSGVREPESDYLLEEATARQDFSAGGREWRAEGGLMESNTPLNFARTPSYSGLRVETNQGFIFRDELLQASDIEIFLPRRSKVEVFRDSQASGERMFSRILDFGTVQIDTRSFRQGSYNIEIVVTDNAGIVTRETRPFTKTAALAPWNQIITDVEVGALRQDLRTSGEPIVAASYRKRLKDWLDGSVGAAATEDDQVGEAALQGQWPFALLGSPGLLDTSLIAAVSGKGEPAGIKNAWGWVGKKGSVRFAASKTYDRSEVENAPGSLALADRQSLSLSLAYPIKIKEKTLSSRFQAEISSSKGGGRHYRYGPSFSYNFDPIGGYDPYMSFDYTVTDEDQQASVRLSIRSPRNQSGWSHAADFSGSRNSEETSSTARAGLAFSGKSSDYEDWRRNFNTSLAVRAEPLTSTKEPSAQLVEASAEYDTKYIKAHGQVEQNIQESTGTLLGDVSSTLLWSRAAGFHAMPAGFAGDEASLLTLRIKGWPGAKVKILVNRHVQGYGAAGDVVVLSLPLYTKARIDILPQDDADVFRVDGGGFDVTGYPGNSLYRELHVVRTFFLTGFLQDETGKPLLNERFIFDDKAFYTDELGWFSMDAPLVAGGENKILTSSRECIFTSPQLSGGDIVVDIGNISCKKPPRAEEVAPPL